MNAKRIFALVFSLSIVALFVGMQPTAVKAGNGTEVSYRVPVIGNFDITQIDCVANGSIPGHSGTPGYRFMDIAVHDSSGTPVYSSGSGAVTRSGWDTTGFGNLVEVTNSQTVFHYAHLDKIYVQVGQQVSQGDLVGLIGQTGGTSTAPHLHWEAKQVNGFDLMSIPGMSIGDPRAGQPCVNANAGTLLGQPRFQWSSCPQFYNDMVAQGFSQVVLFDHRDCEGNRDVLVNNATNDLTTFNDRTRSIYIPPGKSIVASANVNDPMGLHICHTVDMWNVDQDYYDSSSTAVGWKDSVSLPANPSDAGPYGSAGWNMISSVTVLNNTSCIYNGAAIEAAAPGVQPTINGSVTGIGTITVTPSITPSPAPVQGNSRVNIYTGDNYGGTQYGWDNPTNGWYNLSANGQNYMDDQTASIAFREAGWSILVAQDANGGGQQSCFTASNPLLYYTYYPDGSRVWHTISSVWVFQNSYCGVPFAPSNLTVTGVSQTSVSMTFQDNSVNETGFHIYVWNPPNWVFLGSTGANQSSFTLGNLACGTGYTFEVTAYNGAGESGGSNYVGPVTSACSTSTPSPTSTVTWTPSATPQFQVMMSVNPSQVLIGGNITVTYAVTFVTGGDFIGMVPAGSPLGATPLAYQWVSNLQGTFTFAAPLVSGQYVFRYYQGGVPVGESDLFAVVGPTSTPTLVPPTATKTLAPTITRTPTKTVVPTGTKTPTKTPTATKPTATLKPTITKTSTKTNTATKTKLPPTATKAATMVPSTSTKVPPTATQVPPTATPQFQVMMSVSPLQIQAGGNITVTYAVTFVTGGDFIGMVPAGSALGTTPLANKMVNNMQGSFVFSAPGSGQYVFRYYRGGVPVYDSDAVTVVSTTTVPQALPLQPVATGMPLGPVPLATAKP